LPETQATEFDAQAASLHTGMVQLGEIKGRSFKPENVSLMQILDLSFPVPYTELVFDLINLER
jgi:hypothetical protein